MEFVKLLNHLEKETKFKVKHDKQVLLVITKIVDNDQNRDLRKDLDSFSINYNRYQKRSFSSNCCNCRLSGSIPQGIRNYSSTSAPAQAEKLIVNSTYNNIVFVDNQSILLLSSLQNVDLPNVKYAERVKLVINDLKDGGLDRSDSLKYRKPFF